MKLVALCVAALAFVGSVLLTRSGGQHHPTTHIDQASEAGPAQPELSGRMELKFIQFIYNQYHAYAQLKVTNGGPETVRFPGYASNCNSVMFIRQGIWVKPVSSLQTDHGFGTQEMAVGKTVVFDVQSPDGNDPFEVGFAYEVGAEHEWKIVWSEKIQRPAE